jgi:hypothetical protein
VKTIVTVSDLQVPFHHKRAVSALTNFIREWGPDEVVCVGDEIDMPQISRWNKGTAGEYAGKLHKDRDDTVRILEALKVKHVMRSNHGDRLRTYLNTVQPRPGRRAGVAVRAVHEVRRHRRHLPPQDVRVRAQLAARPRR